MPYIRYIAFLVIFCSSASASDSLAVYSNNALFALHHQTDPIVSSNFVAWKEDWKYSSTRISQQVKPNSYTFQGRSNNLNLAISGHTSSTKHSNTWHYRYVASKAHPRAIGFGISFKLNLNSPSFKGLSNDPELLPNHTGWRWKISPQKTIEVRFSPQLATVHFERGRKNEIRAMFFKGIELGDYRFDMTLLVNGVEQLPIRSKKPPAHESSKDWHRNIIPWNSSPVDLAYLNDDHKPAGKHGFLQARGDSLEFADGTSAKFWGANIQAYALFNTSDFNIKKQAKRLARLGFNLIRLHHHDSAWVNPNIFANPQQDTLHLKPSSFKKLDWWIKCLKDEGIYVWLDLQVGRSYTNNDGIDFFDEVAKGKKSHDFKGFNYYNLSIQRRIKEFNHAYLNHVNPFTGFAYKDEPAIVSTLLLNENDLTQHFGNALLANKKVPAHHKMYMADVKAVSKRLNLNPKKAWRSWEHGDSKIYLNDAEHRYNKMMLGDLHQLGVKNTLITGNTWGGMSLASLPSLTDGDMVDVHSYGGEGELLFNPRYRAGMLHWIGAAQVTNKPLSVTEWNVERFPVTDRFTIPTWLASTASLQGWDSLMLYGYSQRPLNGIGIGSNYSTYNDPALMAMMPVSALLYRQGHVTEAKHTYHVRLSKSDFFGSPVTPVTSATLRTLVEQSKVTIDLPYSATLPWLKQHEMAMDTSYSRQSNSHHIVRNSNIDFIPNGQNSVVSDTGEITRDWEKGIHTINTEQSQIVSGNIGGNTFNMDDVHFEINTAKATVAVQSLDDKAISRSTRILISKAARSIPSKAKNAPFLSEPVTGTLFIKAKPGLTLYSIGLNNHKAMTTVYSKERGYQVNLPLGLATPWLILK